MSRTSLCHCIVGFVIVSLLGTSVLSAETEVPLVVSNAPEPTVWKGEHARFFVELRAKGPFAGTASFSLPQIPRTVIVRIGSPVVSSKEIEDESWFIQTHEFALFSQTIGTVTVPSFEVRFGSKDGFTGPEKDHTENVPELTFEIKAPPKSQDDIFLVTTEKIEISESWNPEPKSANVGDIFHRTITQQADQMTGMALAPPPTTMPNGIRLYSSRPEVNDKTDRGDFSGMRKDTLTYEMRQGGTWTVPAIQYVWWNPKTEQYGSKTLPSVTFEVAAPPVTKTEEQAAQSSTRRYFIWLATLLFLAGLVWQHHRLTEWARRIWRSWNPPERVASRKLLKACQQNDAKSAAAAWLEWESHRSQDIPISQSLLAASTELQSHLYGTSSPEVWHGEPLEKAFREQLKTHQRSNATHSGSLPLLNPR